MGSLQFDQTGFDLGFLLTGEFVAKLFELLLGLEGQLIGGVHLLDLLLRLSVGIGVGLGLSLHAGDVVVAQTGTGLDLDGSFLLGPLVLCGYFQQTVCVQVEGYFNLGNAAGGGGNVTEDEAADGTVVLTQAALTLENVNFHARLVVGGRRVDLRLLGGDGRVGFDHLVEHTAHHLDTEAQRSHVEEQNVLNVSAQHATLDSGTYGNHLIGVNPLVRLLTEELLYGFLDGGDTGGTTYEDHLVDVGLVQAGVLQGLLAGLERTLDQFVGQLLELGAADLDDQVLGHTVDGRNVGEIHLRFSRARQLDLSLLGGFLEALEGHRVLGQVDVLLALELTGEKIDQDAVEVITTQVGVTVGGLHFENAVAEVENGDIERTTTKVVDGNRHVLGALVQAVSQGGRGGLVDDPANLQAGDLTGLLGGLPLAVVEVGGHRNDGFAYLGTEEILGGLFHFLQHHRADLLGGVEAAVDVYAGHAVISLHYLIGYAADVVLGLVETHPHKALDGGHGPGGVRDGLAFGRLADLALTTVQEGDNGGSGVATLLVVNNGGLTALHYGYTRVGRT